MRASTCWRCGEARRFAVVTSAGRRQYNPSVPLPLSRSQIERLGLRLVATSEPSAADVAALHDVLRAYSAVLDGAVTRVREGSELAPTSRIKNTGTILEKLRRYGGSWLKSIQDLAGMRVVGTLDRAGQDDLVEEIVALFGDAPKAPKIIDRRASPVNGYRAVHVIVFPASVPVEIQVRTQLQHEWAELFEKLADIVGRGIRYGEPPAPLLSDSQRLVADADMVELSRLGDAFAESLIESALALAEAIAAVEELEHSGSPATDLPALRQQIADGLARLARAVDQLEGLTRRMRRILDPGDYD